MVSLTKLVGKSIFFEDANVDFNTHELLPHIEESREVTLSLRNNRMELLLFLL